MKKLITRSGTVAAALAASAVLLSVPAVAQTPQSYKDAELAGAPAHDGPPSLYRDRDDRGDYRDRDYRDRDDWRRDRKPDFQTVQRECSRAAIQEAWRRGYYSAQYHGGPQLVAGRNGYEMRGKVRLHDRSGYRYSQTICDVRNGRVVDFDFVR
ncbi:MAG: hypothetical protein R3C52_12050 [Hyphomonadaceae bacterium]